MHIIIFGGTTEGRILSHELSRIGAEVTVCVATEYGAEEQGNCKNIKVMTGRKGYSEITELINQYEICIDATHPYAVEISENLKQACNEKELVYLRLLRENSKKADGTSYVETAEEAKVLLQKTEGNILIATGVKELSYFRELDRDRLYPRILPTVDSILVCEKEKIPKRNIIAMQGPFSKDLNEALMKQFDIKYMVTKDGGNAGGFMEKIEAANEIGVKTIVIERPNENGKSYDEVLQLCQEMIKCR